MGDEHILVQESGQGQIGGVAIVAMQGDEAGLGQGPGQGEDIGCPHAFPVQIQAAPGGDAMEIGNIDHLGQGHEAAPIQFHLPLHPPVQSQTPVLVGDIRQDAQVQHGKFRGQMLARGDTFSAHHLSLGLTMVRQDHYFASASGRRPDNS